MDDEDFDSQLRATLRSATKDKYAAAELVARLVANARAQQSSVVPFRRRRAVWLAPLIAAAAVALVAGGSAIVISATRSESVRPATHQPSPPVSHVPTKSPTASPTATGTSTSTRPATSSTATSPTSVPALSGRWTAATVIITQRSLGAVTRGMTLAQAQAAAGTPLKTPGDGIYQPADQKRMGSTQLSLSSWAGFCFDATRLGTGPGTTVTTAAGVSLGEPMSRVRPAYPRVEAFTADPSWTGYGNIPAGLIVHFADGVLLFVGSTADHRGGTITSIRGAADAEAASSLRC